jgi:hypothetical protein
LLPDAFRPLQAARPVDQATYDEALRAAAIARTYSGA